MHTEHTPSTLLAHSKHHARTSMPSTHLACTKQDVPGRITHAPSTASRANTTGVAHELNTPIYRWPLPNPTPPSRQLDGSKMRPTADDLRLQLIGPDGKRAAFSPTLTNAEVIAQSS